MPKVHSSRIAPHIATSFPAPASPALPNENRPEPGLQKERATPETFIGETITPRALSFDSSPMANGEPALPTAFWWRKQEYHVAEVLEQWRELGDCRHGSGERYLRKHWYRIRTDGGSEMKIYFQRQARSRAQSRARWRLFSLTSGKLSTSVGLRQ